MALKFSGVGKLGGREWKKDILLKKKKRVGGGVGSYIYSGIDGPPKGSPIQSNLTERMVDATYEPLKSGAGEWEEIVWAPVAEAVTETVDLIYFCNLIEQQKPSS